VNEIIVPILFYPLATCISPAFYTKHNRNYESNGEIQVF